MADANYAKRRFSTVGYRIRAAIVTHFVLPAHIGLILLAVHATPALGLAQPEAEGPVAEGPVAEGPVFDVNQFEALVFEELGTATEARARLDNLLWLQTDLVHHVCGLSPTQRKKLELAGRGDIRRFFENVDVVRKKLLQAPSDEERFNEVFQEVQPLQIAFKAGLFNEGSFFLKALPNTLSEDQCQRYLNADTERRRFSYRAKVELAVAMLENELPLRDVQRRQLISLILAETKPLRTSTAMDYYAVMWSVTKIPEDKLRPLFNDVEWRAFSRQLEPVRGLEQDLRESGALEKDSGPAEGK